MIKVTINISQDDIMFKDAVPIQKDTITLP
jgi:hypothetical protein